MPIDHGGVRTPVKNGDIFEQTGCVHGSQFAIIDENDYTKQIQFDASSLATTSTTTIKGAATAGDITLTLPSTTGTIATTGQLGITQLTGDVTAGPGSGSQVATIPASTITNAKMANMAGNTVKANVTGSAAAPTDASATSTPSTVSSFVIRNANGLISDNDLSYQSMLWEDFLGGSTPGGMKNNNSGTNSKSTIRAAGSSNAHPGVWSLQTGTTNTGNGNLFGSDTDQVFSPVGAGTFTFEATVQIPTLSNGTDRFTVLVGMTSDPYSADVTPSEGIYFQYVDNVDSGNWSFNCTAASTSTGQNTGTSASAGAWIKLGFIINAAGTSVQAYVNGVAAGSPITTNISVANLMLAFVNTKSAGTNNREFYIDYYKVIKTFTTPR